MNELSMRDLYWPTDEQMAWLQPLACTIRAVAKMRGQWLDIVDCLADRPFTSG